MTIALLTVLILMSFHAGEPAPEPRQPSTSTMLFDFDNADSNSWQVVNDGVMGGRSRGSIEFEDGALRFFGTLVTRGGGFTSVRTERRLDLGEYDGLELRVRGGGRTLEVELGDGASRWGRRVSRRAAFTTQPEWAWVRVPFSELRATMFGQAVRARPIDLADIRSVGVYILDGIDGPFRLEVDAIRAYRLGAQVDDIP